MFSDFWAPEKVTFNASSEVLPPPPGRKYLQGPHMDLCPLYHVLIRQPSKKQILFANLVHFFSLSPFSFFLGPFFGIFLTPSMAICAPKVPIWHWVPRHTLLDDPSAKKELILICGSCFRTFGHPKKVILDVCYAVLTPSWGSKCPQGPHIDLYPYFHVLPLQLTKKQILFSYVVHFLSATEYIPSRTIIQPGFPEWVSASLSLSSSSLSLSCTFSRWDNSRTLWAIKLIFCMVNNHDNLLWIRIREPF